jgi:hypothetical protein
MTFFGLITVPLWPTFIAALVLAPLAARHITTHPRFSNLSPPLFASLSLLAGAAGGIGVMLPIVVLALTDSFALALNWAGAGAVSGAVTSLLVCFFYRACERQRRT